MAQSQKRGGILDSSSQSSTDDGSNSDVEASALNYSKNQSPVPGSPSKKTDGAMPPPAPLYYDRDEAEGWFDEGDDSYPKTGTPVMLKKSSPKFLMTSPQNEPFEPSRISAPQHDCGLEPQQFVRPKNISSDGYPTGLRGKLVYDCLQLNAERRVRRNSLEPAYKITDEFDTTLIFDSLLESANLYQAYQVSEYEYDLVLKNDFNTNGHTQWYYFQIENTRKQTEYKFNIVNFYKRSSMYNTGLRPLLYSQKAATTDQLGWHRAGSAISYRRNDHFYYKGSSKKVLHSYYTLSFTIVFPFQQDVCYLAHCFPYTYSDLQQYLTKLESDSRIRKIFRRKLLCRTMAGNRCDVITITNTQIRTDNTEANLTDSKLEKKCVVLSARVHPGETNSSWIMKGCIDFLVGETSEANHLRDSFVFKIVPMLNPDGVINGSYRTGLAGCDLNRKWKDPSASFHPTIFHFKALLCRIRSEREIAMFVDLHGHSVKRNAFIYGCDSVHWEEGDNHGSRQTPLPNESRMFPAQLNNSCQYFSYVDCRFHIKARKESSSRVVCWREFTSNSYTLEASFGGGDREHEPSNQHYGIHHYEAIGADLCRAVSQFFVSDETVRATLHESIMSTVTEIVLPQADSDDDEGNEKGELSSDDDSDDETVESIVLPNKAANERPKHTRPNKKLLKPRNAGARASLSNILKDYKKIEEKAAEKTPAKAISPPNRETPREKEEIKTLVRSADQRAGDRRSPERALSARRTTPAQPINSSETVCNCPSCQVYAEFIAAGTPQVLQPKANFDSGDVAPSSRPAQHLGTVHAHTISDIRRYQGPHEKGNAENWESSSAFRPQTISVSSPPRQESLFPAAKDAARSPHVLGERPSPTRTAPFTATSMSARPAIRAHNAVRQDRGEPPRLSGQSQGGMDSRDLASGPQQQPAGRSAAEVQEMMMPSPQVMSNSANVNSARVSRLRRLL